MKMQAGSGREEEGGVYKEFDDGRSYDSVAVHRITQNWVDKHMTARQMDFTSTVEAKIFCGTWNVNGKTLKQEDEDLADWLCPRQPRGQASSQTASSSSSYYTNDKNEPIADIYCIGFQEMVDLTAVNVAIDSKSQQRGHYWEEKISDCLQQCGGHYSMIMSKHLVGLFVCVFVKNSLLGNVHDVRATAAGVGVMGVMGNKGGASIRLTLYDSSICVVCAHLAAHRENVTGRNNDYHSILDKSLFNPLPESLDPIAHYSQQHHHDQDNTRKLNYSTGLSTTQDLTILEHDLVFWLGDLNYRMDESLRMDEVFEKVKQEDWAYLREYDQLNIERFGMNVFEGFMEGELNFAPTYKYQPGTSDYDQRPDKKVRCPAWCDRVLWRSKSALDAVNQICYTRSENLVSSDHKPVMSLFTCRIRQIMKDKEREVFQELMRELDKCENDSIPRVEMNIDTADFGELHFQEPKTVKLVLKNTGTSVAHWRFISKLEDVHPCKRWMTFEPSLGMLLPGEDAEILMTSVIDARTADALNSSRESLDDILVLRIENGKDFFITVKGSFARSCYGMSLAQLVCATEPVRSIPLPSANTSANESNQTGQMSIPKELWRLVDALWQGGMRERDLFVSSADPSEVSCIRECLDTGTQFPSCSAHSIVEALLQFISSLPQPLLPPDLYPTLADVEPPNLRAWSRNFLEQLPPINYNVFVYLLSFERELLALREFNRLSAVKLASINLACMMVDNSTSRGKGQQEVAAAEVSAEAKAALHSVMLHFLTSSSL